MVQVKFSPYVGPILNEMEKRSMIVSTISIYSGMFFLLDEATTSLQMFFFLLMVAANLYFFIYWGVEFLKAKASALLKIKCIEKRCGSCIRKIA
mmetsp:Transcript_6732/g.6043  ORF Transcript_6732/g.6043 Transcript_6732/m.6043 type:complete len:94 (+) Transcript_6732:1384-1665(+)